jgi:hypothetical protein
MLKEHVITVIQNGYFETKILYANLRTFVLGEQMLRSIAGTVKFRTFHKN